MMRRARRIILWLVLLALLFLWAFPRLFLASQKGYFIPAESSFWSFRETVGNPGSGEWWLYGEDDANFYALVRETPHYLVIPKSDLPVGFDPLDQKTWGRGAILRPVP